MKADIDYKFGQSLYLKNDEDQIEYLLHRIILCPKGQVVLELFGPDGEIMEVLEAYCIKEKDVLKATGATKKEEEDED